MDSEQNTFDETTSDGSHTDDRSGGAGHEVAGGGGHKDEITATETGDGAGKIPEDGGSTESDVV